MRHPKGKIEKSECKNKNGSNSNLKFTFSEDIFFVNASHQEAMKKILPEKTPILSGFSYICPAVFKVTKS